MNVKKHSPDGENLPHRSPFLRIKYDSTIENLQSPK